MTNRVITVTVDGKTVTVNGNDPARVLNVGPPGADGDTFVPDPTAEPDDRWLTTLAGALVYTDAPAGGGGAVDSVNGQTGVVVLDADDLADGTTNHVFTAADDTKLAGVATGATANDTDANLKARANHTGTQAISTVSGLQTALDDKAPLASPALTGNPTAPTQTAGNNSTRLATTAYVDTADALKAPLASPVLTGNPTAPTPTAADNDTSIATTAFVQGEIAAKAPLASPTFTGNPLAPTPSAGDNDTSIATTAFVTAALLKQQEVLIVALSDETTAITTGTAKVTMRMPFAMTLTAVRASLTTASSSGIPTVDINEAGTTILSTKLTIDASELTSTTAATAAVISDTSLADDAEITFDIDVAGTGAKGLKVTLLGTRT